MPHLMKQIKIADGEYEIINPTTGNGRVNGKAQPLSIPELITEIKDDPNSAFADAFKSKPKEKEVETNTDEQKPTKKKVVSVDSIKDMKRAGLEAIASGAVDVEFDDTICKLPDDAIPLSEMNKLDKGTLEKIASGEQAVDMNK